MGRSVSPRLGYMLLIWVFDRVCSIKMARYWPSVVVFFSVFMVNKGFVLQDTADNPEQERLPSLSIIAHDVIYLGRSQS